MYVNHIFFKNEFFMLILIETVVDPRLILAASLTIAHNFNRISYDLDSTKSEKPLPWLRLSSGESNPEGPTPVLHVDYCDVNT
jgi:hypothetical protein